MLIGIGMVGLVAMPFTPMRLRGTASLSTDAPHIVVTGVLVLCILVAIGLTASQFGPRFRRYSYATLLTLLVFGAWTGVEAGRLAAGQPTPWLGVVERIHIGAYLIWVGALALTIARSRVSGDSGRRPLRRVVKPAAA
jgi:hypothetical protein